MKNKNKTYQIVEFEKDAMILRPIISLKDLRSSLKNVYSSKNV